MRRHNESCRLPRTCRCREHHGPAIRGFLIPCLLNLLKEAPCHGYQLIEQLEARGYMTELPDPGVIYRHLRHLERDAMVTSSFEAGGGPARKVYTVTDEGLRHLEDWVTKLTVLQKNLECFLSDAK